MSRVRGLFFLIFFAFLCACGGGRSSLPPDTLVIGIIGDMDTVNDYASHSAFTSDLTKNLYLQLMEEQPDFTEKPPSFKPMLASSWDISEDGTVYTVHLREGVTWSDGTPVTSEDILFTHNAATSEEMGWSGRGSKASIERVEAPDPQTVVFTLTHSYPYALMDINEGKILPAHVWKKIPPEDWVNHDFSKNMVVSGPYTLTDWRRGESILLSANPSYYRKGYPKINHILFQIIPDQNSLLQQLLAGTIDVMAVIPPKDAVKVKESQNVRLVQFGDIQYGYIGWNLTNPLFRSKEVRRALTMGIDRESIVQTVWYGYAKVAASPIIADFWAHNNEVKPLPYDPETARQILKEQGWEDHDGDGILDRDNQPFAFTLITNSGNKIRNDIAVLVQRDLGTLGIKVNIQLLDFNPFIQRLMGKEFDACVNGLAVATKLDFRDLWHTDAIDPEQGINVVSYSNPEADRLLAEVVELPLDRQKPLWDQIQAIIAEDLPFTFLYENDRLNGVSTRVTHFEMNALSSYYRLEEWTLAR